MMKNRETTMKKRGKKTMNNDEKERTNTDKL